MAFGHLRAHTPGNFAFHNRCTEVKYAVPQVYVAYSRQETQIMALRKAHLRSFGISLLSFAALLQGGSMLTAQATARQTVSILCKCDDEGRSFAEMLAKKLPANAYQLVSADRLGSPASIHITVVSNPVVPSKAAGPEDRTGAPSVTQAVMTVSSSRQPVHSTISIECDFPGGRLMEEVRHCDRVGLASLVDEVAADMTAAFKMEPVEVETDEAA